ncbi:hypothetical protein [Afifella aestuarii]|uniref:hypothetical protein n=1 Tax=Afifella aestuarii TaxID=1909496 RepID=UPI000FE3D9FC|nr:hypothetical protein [Afifella aestuarii]
MSLKTLPFLLLAGAAWIAPAHAQTITIKAPAHMSGAAVAKVDESALRYYARNQELDRVEAEIHRLQQLHPGWTPPDDLFTQVTGGSDETEFWELFAADRLDDLEAAIEERRHSEPGWQPSEDLRSKVAYKRARQRLVNASDLKQWGKVLDIAGGGDIVLSTADVDVMWRVAEADAHNHAEREALALYEKILQDSSNSDERLGTIQKALGLLPVREVETLISLGRTNPDGSNEFDIVEDDLLRARIGAIAAGEDVGTVSRSELVRFEDGVEADKSAMSDAALLGWFYYGQNDWQDAARWFKTSLDRGGDVKSAEGAVLSLSALEKLDEAEAIAAKWEAQSAEVRSLFLGLGAARLSMDPPPDLTRDYVAKLANAIEETQSGDGAQALAWYHYNTKSFDDAQSWFRQAMAWQPQDTTALGLVLATFHLKQWSELADLLKSFSPDYPSVAAVAPQLKRPTRTASTIDRTQQVRAARVAQRVNDLFGAKRYREALALLDEFDGKSRGMMMLRGWALYHVHQIAEAREIFRKLDAKSSTKETREALAWIMNAQLPARHR